MRAVAILLAGLIAGAVPATAIAASPAPAAAQDWSQRVEATAEGGFRMGNPDAAVKLVEYASITCSHCATFNEAASRPLRERHIRSGRVSWEVRPYLIFPSDPGITLLLQCQSPTAFFDTSDELFATQDEWTGLIAAATERLAAISNVRRQLVGVLHASGVDRLFKRNGMTGAQVASCLEDEARWQGLAQLQERANAAGVEGTPSFFLNGRAVEPASWPDLETMINAAAPN